MPALIEDENRLLSADTEKYIQEAFDAALECEGVFNAFASVMIVGDSEILDLNRRMRNVNSVTDVLSFPSIRYPENTVLRDKTDLIRKTYEPDIGGFYLGDIAINIKRAREQAKEYGHSLNRELAYLSVHALMHLCGYDHMTEEDKAIMRSREKQVMSRIGLFKSNP